MVGINTPWQDALNTRLLQSLWRRIERPGLIELQQLRALVNRHQTLTAGLPLAEQLLRRAAPLPELQALTVPIVYAQSQPTTPVVTPAAEDGDDGNRGEDGKHGKNGGNLDNNRPSATAQAETPIKPLVKALPIAADRTDSGPNQSLVQRTPSATAVTGSTQRTVKQYKIDPAALATGVLPSTPSALTALQTPTSPATLSTARATPSSNAGIAPTSSDTLTSPAARTSSSPAATTRPTSAAEHESGLPLVSGTTRTRAQPELLNSYSNQVGEQQTQQRSRIDQPGLGPLPVVTEQRLISRYGSAHSSTTDSRLPGQQPALPLATATAPTQPTAGRTKHSDQPPSWAAPPQKPRKTLLAAHDSNRSATTEDISRKNAAADIKSPDTLAIERIVDRVHRKFLQRLAIENERRGMK